MLHWSTALIDLTYTSHGIAREYFHLDSAERLVQSISYVSIHSRIVTMPRGFGCGRMWVEGRLHGWSCQRGYKTCVDICHYVYYEYQKARINNLLFQDDQCHLSG